jgi:lipopolysaccharide/colanic/teichoic acid biosynthesis glycosyltransferase
MTTKRGIDILAGTVLAALALPVIAVLAIGCAIALRTSPFFVQRRVGRGGREFPLPKLRTLPRSAPATVDKYALRTTSIPRFCRFLRHNHIDELPQLLVVPLGWMSLVGPRPEMPALMARYPAELVAARTRVRPGCTGLWQVSSASTRCIYEAPEYDLAYVDNAGLRLDAWIVYRTVHMWVRRGAVIELDDVPRWAWTLPPPSITYGPAPVLDLRPDALHRRAAWTMPVIDLTTAERAPSEPGAPPAVLPPLAPEISD